MRGANVMFEGFPAFQPVTGAFNLRVLQISGCAKIDEFNLFVSCQENIFGF